MCCVLTSSLRFETRSTVASGRGGAARARRAGDAGVMVRAPKAGKPTPPTPTPYGEANPEPRPKNCGASTPPPIGRATVSATLTAILILISIQLRFTKINKISRMIL